MIKKIRYLSDGFDEYLCEQCGQIFERQYDERIVVCDVCEKAGSALGSEPAKEDKTVSVVPPDNDSSEDDERT